MSSPVNLENGWATPAEGISELRHRMEHTADPAERARLRERIEALAEAESRDASGGGRAIVTGGSHLRRDLQSYRTGMMVPEVGS